MSTSKTTIDIPDNEQHTTVETQYGMRFPDGTNNWEYGFMTTSGRRVYWGVMAKGERLHDQQTADWDRHMETTARAAHIDPVEFASQHQLVKRTVVVAVTEAEDV